MEMKKNSQFEFLNKKKKKKKKKGKIILERDMKWINKILMWNNQEYIYVCSAWFFKLATEEKEEETKKQK